jgi:hypothetical protein
LHRIITSTIELLVNNFPIKNRINLSILELFNKSLTSKTKHSTLLDIISNAAEYENIPIDRYEENILKQV